MAKPFRSACAPVHDLDVHHLLSLGVPASLRSSQMGGAADIAGAIALPDRPHRVAAQGEARCRHRRWEERRCRYRVTASQSARM